MKKILAIFLVFAVTAGIFVWKTYPERHVHKASVNDQQTASVDTDSETPILPANEKQIPDSSRKDTGDVFDAATVVSCKAACAEEIGCALTDADADTAQTHVNDEEKAGVYSENNPAPVAPDSSIQGTEPAADIPLAVQKDDSTGSTSDIEPVETEDDDSLNKADSETISDTTLAVVVNSDENSPDVDEPDILTIPEYEWPDYHTRERRELTEDIALQYPRGKHVPRHVENSVFGVGEKLQFSIDYGFYRAGTAVLSVAGTEMVNGDECYRIESKANSNKFISTFYKVRDKVCSFVDVNGLFSRRFEKNLREGGYSSDRYVDFYHDRLIALNTKDKEAVKEIPLYIQDILSSLYILRTFDLKIGQDEFIDVYADGKVYPLRIIIHTIENIDVPAGKFSCFKVEPVLESEGLFRSKGRLLVWLSFDEYKMPVKMTSKIPIGSIGANLESYTYGDI